jgi:type IV pilus assembly protein PilM
MADNYFCLDIDEKFTKIVDAKKGGDLIEVYALGKTETQELFYTSNLEKNIEDQANKIRKLIETSNINKKNVNIIIPDTLNYSQIISMPLINEKELITAIKYQADQFIPMPIEETNIDIQVIEEDQKEKKVLLLIVAAPKKITERIQTVTEMAGLNPESIENELSANARFINTFNKNILNQYKISSSQGIVIANFDNSSTALSYYSTSELVVKETHHISIGYQLFLKETQINTDTDLIKSQEILRTFNKKNISSLPLEKIVLPLIKEFSNELRIFINKYHPSTILFTNKIFLFPSLVDSLQEELGLSVSIYDPNPLFKKSSIIDIYKNEIAVFISALGGNLR